MKTKAHQAKTAATALLALALAGCGGMNQNEMGSSLIGGVAGAVLGSRLGKGSGKTAAIALGAVL